MAGVHFTVADVRRLQKHTAFSLISVDLPAHVS